MSAGPPILDAHMHVWDLSLGTHPWLVGPPIPFRYGDYAPIRRSFAIADYRRATEGFDVRGTVYVEAEWDPADPLGETRWVHALAAREGLPSAMVAQAWLDREDVEELLAAQAAFPLVRGVRHKPRAAPSPDRVEPGRPGSLSCPRFARGFALLGRFGLSFDLQVPWWHLHEAYQLFTRYPEVEVILNHTGLPADRSREGLEGWRAALAQLAELPQVAIKISGIGIRGRPWTVVDNAPIVRTVLELFGPDRCMFASNWPVDTLCADFRTIFDGFFEITRDLPEAEREKLFFANACRIYRIDPGVLGVAGRAGAGPPSG
ncbi:MAG: amidohydrolase family protein [Geminicoccaceae bacterium]|nr:amidohydrolase family protein [Geminicoccaceae bacterium]MDW8369349.1 amidohydrolase family protein [Geminicoccaceae bacterium]